MLLTVADWAKLNKVATQAAYLYLNQGRIEFELVNGQYMIDSETQKPKRSNAKAPPNPPKPKVPQELQGHYGRALRKAARFATRSR